MIWARFQQGRPQLHGRRRIVNGQRSVTGFFFRCHRQTNGGSRPDAAPDAGVIAAIIGRRPSRTSRSAVFGHVEAGASTAPFCPGGW